MNSSTESGRWLKDAGAGLVSAERALAAQDYRVAVQNAQLCVEHSAKAVIALLAEPVWRHDPSPQLLRLLKAHGAAIVERCGEAMLTALRQLAQDAETAAPWHAWSTYGRETEQGPAAAVDLCNQETAEDLLELARRALPAARRLTAQWSQPEPPP